MIKIILAFLFCSTAFADSLMLPNLNHNATGTLSGGKYGLDVNINSGTIVVTPQTNSAGTYSSSTTIGAGSATTFTVPANAVGFLIEASSSNAVNLRYAIGATATTTSGVRLEPGRDSGYVPLAADISVIAESSTNQEVQIQWVKTQ